MTNGDDIIRDGDGAEAVPVKVGKPRQRPLRRLGRGLLIVCLILFIGLIGIFLYVDTVYARGILPRTKVNGLSVSGLTAEAASQLLTRDLLPQHQVALTIGDTVIEPTTADLGVSYPVRQVVTQAYVFGHESSWLKRIVSTVSAPFIERDLKLSPRVDEEKLRAYVDALVQSNIKEAADATLLYNKGQVTIKDSEVGQAVDGDQLYEDLLNAGGEIKGYDVTASVAVVVPQVTNEALTTWRDRLVRLAAVPVTLTATDRNVILTKEQKLPWFSLNKDGDNYAIAINEAAVLQTLAAVSKKLTKTPINDQVGADGSVLVPGDDGFNFDQTATLAQLLPALNAALATESAGQSPAEIQLAATTTSIVRQQVRASVATTGETVAPALDTEARFVQLALAAQKMYLFENRRLINIFAISSGKKGYETPKGVHKIYSKSVRAWSRAYSLYLPYWNAITADGGYGIHDLPEWPGGYKEPETHLGTPVSHGCIRLSTANAKYFYEWAPLGMAVVVQ